MTTVQDIIYKARALLDQYTEEGIIISESEVIDIEKKMILFIDTGQKELYSSGRLFETLEFANKPIEPVGGRASGFNIIEFIGDTQYYPDENGTDKGKSYHIEADNTHTIEIQEYESGIWQTLYIHSGVALVPFIQYKGNITVTTLGNKVRMKVSGTTYFRHINRAFFPYSFVTVPDYRQWVRKEMPSNFRLLDSIVEEFPPSRRETMQLFKWEEPNIFVYSYYYEGNIRIKYKPVPVTLTAKTDIIQIDDITAEALSFFAASWVAPFEAQSMTNPLFQKYSELKFSLAIEQPTGSETITDVYGGGFYA